MEDNYLDTILGKLESYIIGHKGDLPEHDFYDISFSKTPVPYLYEEDYEKYAENFFRMKVR